MYTTDDQGVLNNYAKEPKTYYAEYPTPAQQQRYWTMGAIFTLFMSGLVAIAFAVS